MVTWANFHYLDFVMNWVGHLRALGVSNFIVGAMDDKMLAALRERGVPTFAMNLNSLTTGDFGWGSSTFHKMGRQKIALISKFTELGVDILLTDVDTAYTRCAMPISLDRCVALIARLLRLECFCMRRLRKRAL